MRSMGISPMRIRRRSASIRTLVSRRRPTLSGLRVDFLVELIVGGHRRYVHFFMRCRNIFPKLRVGFRKAVVAVGEFAPSYGSFLGWLYYSHYFTVADHSEALALVLHAVEDVREAACKLGCRDGRFHDSKII